MSNLSYARPGAPTHRRLHSAFIADSDGRAARPQSTQLSETRGARSRMNAMNASKRSTRLFGSFGGGSGSEKNAGIEGLRRTSGSTIGGSGREGPSSMSPKTVDAATSEMTRIQPEAVTDGSNLLERIGNPDYSGWMRKKGEKYNSWKQRFFVLKGIHLYWLKTESVSRARLVTTSRRETALFTIVGAKSQGFHQPSRLPYYLGSRRPRRRIWIQDCPRPRANSLLQCC